MLNPECNIFLDFLNRDSRQIFDLYRHVPRDVHIRVLREMLNLAVFITRDHCVMPPGFLAEDRLVREVMETKQAFREERLILLPMRESLDEYWAKKEREYASVRGQYSGLFSREGRKFVEQNARLLTDRPFVIGSRLLRRWEEAPDSSRYWHERFRMLPPSVIQLFGRVPAYIADDGEAITWQSIYARIPEVARRHPEYRRLVQHIYFGIYMQHLDLRILTRLPYVRDDFGLGSGDLFYDYEGLRTVIEPSGLWNRLLTMSAYDIVALRKTSGYFAFREASRQLIDRCRDHFDLKKLMALPESDLQAIRISTREADLAQSGQIFLPLEGINFSSIEAFGERISRVVKLALERGGDRRTAYSNQGNLRASRAKEKDSASTEGGKYGYVG